MKAKPRSKPVNRLRVDVSSESTAVRSEGLTHSTANIENMERRTSTSITYDQPRI